MSQAMENVSVAWRGTFPQALPKLLYHSSTHPCNSLLITGASVNIIDNILFEMLSPRPTLNLQSLKIHAYGSKATLNMIRHFQTEIKFKDCVLHAMFHVICHEEGLSISHFLSAQTALVRGRNDSACTDISYHVVIPWRIPWTLFRRHGKNQGHLHQTAHRFRCSACHSTASLLHPISCLQNMEKELKDLKI